MRLQELHGCSISQRPHVAMSCFRRDFVLIERATMLPAPPGA